MDNEFTQTILAKVAQFRAEVQAILDKIAALELAYETLTGDALPGSTTTQAPAEAKSRGKRRRVNRDSGAMTLAFMKECAARGKLTVTIKQTARHLKCTPDAAGQQLNKLVKTCQAKRVEPGVFRLPETASGEE